MECPKCKGECQVGFGLAGGGYGPYFYCEECGIIVEKFQEIEDKPDATRTPSG